MDETETESAVVVRRLNREIEVATRSLRQAESSLETTRERYEYRRTELEALERVLDRFSVPF